MAREKPKRKTKPGTPSKPKKRTKAHPPATDAAPPSPVPSGRQPASARPREPEPVASPSTSPPAATPSASLATPADAPPAVLTPDKVREELARRYDELQAQRKTVDEVFARNHDRLAALPDVTGLCVGLRQSNGRTVTPLEYCIQVNVRQKLPPGHPRILNPIEPFIEGVRVNVTPGEYELAIGTDPMERFVAMLRGGIPIATPVSANEFGTMGKVVFTSNGMARYLTNMHVAGMGSQVRQPPNGQAPAGQDSTIGQVISAARDAEIDAAVIAPSGSRQFDFGLITPDDKVLDGLFLPSTLTTADEQRTVCFKIGAVTGSRDLTGVVQSVSKTINVAGHVMQNQIEVVSETGATIIEGGDSGSLLIAPTVKNGTEIYLIVGLVHAKSNANGGIIACHFSKVLSRFGISVFDI